jgi:hypothetical protein
MVLGEVLGEEPQLLDRMPPSPVSANHRLDQTGSPLGKRAVERTGEFPVGVHPASRHAKSLCRPRPVDHRSRELNEHQRLWPGLGGTGTRKLGSVPGYG